MKITVLDIDGTLADVPDDSLESPDLIKFIRDFNNPDSGIAENLEPFAGIFEAVRKVVDKSDKLFVVTARPERLRKTTLAWLARWFGIIPDKLVMRNDGDSTPSAIFKQSVVIDQILPTIKSDMNIQFFDDNPRVLKLLKTFGEVHLAPNCWYI